MHFMIVGNSAKLGHYGGIGGIACLSFLLGLMSLDCLGIAYEWEDFK